MGFLTRRCHTQREPFKSFSLWHVPDSLAKVAQKVEKDDKWASFQEAFEEETVWVSEVAHPQCHSAGCKNRRARASGVGSLRRSSQQLRWDVANRIILS